MGPKGAAANSRNWQVDDVWQITGAGDQQLQRLAHSSRRDTLELGAEDNDGLSQQACTALSEE